jgi:hypothetical protein
MNDWAPAVAAIGLATVCGTTLVLRGPVGKALAEWIRGWSQHDAQWLAMKAARGGGGTETTRLDGEVDDLKRQLADVEERLDFTERLLAQERQGARLPPAR